MKIKKYWKDQNRVNYLRRIKRFKSRQNNSAKTQTLRLLEGHWLNLKPIFPIGKKTRLSCKLRGERYNAKLQSITSKIKHGSIGSFMGCDVIISDQMPEGTNFTLIHK